VPQSIGQKTAVSGWRDTDAEVLRMMKKKEAEYGK
jgi:hypothetical protein